MDLTVKPTIVSTHLNSATKVKRPLFIWGPPGIGKSEIVEDFAINKMPGNNTMIDLRLALFEPNDLRGYPWRNPETNRMEWSPADELPSTDFAQDYDNVVLFLDELNSAPPSVQAAAYQLVLNRRIGKYQLPDNVVIIAAGNRENDRGVTYKMPAPLANRFRHVGMEVNFDDWYSWAIKNEINTDVTGYLSYFKSDLFDFDPKNASSAWASPRSWVFCSELLDAEFDDLEPAVQKSLVAGAIGEGMASKFVEHRRVSKLMPTADEIFSGEAKKLDSLMDNEISAKYAMINALSYELNQVYLRDSTSFKTALNNSLRFVFANTSPEMVVLMLRTVLQEYRIKFNIRNDLDKDVYKTFSEKYTGYINN